MQNSNETTVFLKLLSILNIEEIQKLLVHYFNRVVDLKESGKENDDIIAKLDVSKFFFVCQKLDYCFIHI